MIEDYLMNSERHSQHSSAGHSRGNTLYGFVAGLIVGLAIALVVAYMINRNAPQEKQNVRAPDIAVVPKPSANGDSSEPRDINSPLKGKNSKAEEVDKSSAANDTQVKKTESVITFWLQIGAYSNRGDAEAQRAAVAMQGIQAVVSEHMVDEKKLWRVRIGPFASAQESSATKSKLEEANIAYSLIKVNK